ncbi:MAG: ribosomal subunit interface protein [Candidatus Wildermuthbacteria bacterium RIFCSPLOWO2_01_FULL_47_18]|uniref:Ribosomal subunit interface protein n=2 Tax=Candidatus Wildermuthiibacteriota TaxID=1817923 RepID=A0A1G2RIT4_9BACT|nr:MAG: ribosomal subunit interface protein [Candidatus Wildermuthbacteria bacterium RIFCSPHIGHO2_02_FULL_48_16]OHA72763.1 MAG: ribosomal subunit interface protein [Candidatus Wildermuthbacteria bacterium RIFCSPLOWO2_01_FULL_47_18]
MRIDLKKTELELMPEARRYIEQKMESLAKFIKRYEEKGETHLFVEIARTTKHHQKGPIFYAEATIELPKAVLRAEANAYDVRSAVDQLKDILKREMEKYKEKNEITQRRRNIQAE